MQPPPKTQFVAITFDNGDLGIMQFVVQEYRADGSVKWERLATKEAVDEEIARSVFDHRPLSWRFIEPGDLPQDRTFRRAWKDSGHRIEHDLDRARAHVLQRVRELRQPQLDELDRQWHRHTSRRDEAATAKVEAERQRLRDLPDALAPALAAARTVEELKPLLTV